MESRAQALGSELMRMKMELAKSGKMTLYYRLLLCIVPFIVAPRAKMFLITGQILTGL